MYGENETLHHFDNFPWMWKYHVALLLRCLELLEIFAFFTLYYLRAKSFVEL